MPPTIDELLVADDPGTWCDVGFTVDPDGVCRIGTVRVRLDPGAGRTGVRAWSLRDLPDEPGLGTDSIDGLPTTASTAPPARPAEHDIGALRVDHVVVITPDLPRTIRALEEAGLHLRRTRDTEAAGAPMRQAFFRMGEVVLEVVGPVEPQGEGGPARFFGLALTVADLDGVKARLGDRVGTPKPAVQPGRRICTVRPESGVRTAVALMTPEPSG